MPFGTVNFIRKGDGEIMNEPVIELKHITKRFAKVLANDDVSITIHKGEVVALLGENGAGKSTIMKILYGLYHATSGEIWIDGKERKIATPKEAMDAGISMIQQHFSLVPAHTVTEIYCMTDDFCKEFSFQQEKYMIEDKKIGHPIM